MRDARLPSSDLDVPLKFPLSAFQGPSAKFDRSVSMLAWALNEEALVGEFLDRAFQILHENVADYEIVFINDGSSDRTGEILAAYCEREPRLKVLTNETNLNVGLSCRRAVEAASKEFLFWQTVDWSYDISDLRLYLELLRYYDVVQGIRPVPERLLSHIPLLRSLYRVKTRSDNFKKAFISLSNYYVQRVLFGVPFHDFQNVTFYPTKFVQSLGLRARTPFVNPEMLIRAYYRGAHFIEVPIAFIPRSKGHAKGAKLTTVVRTLWDVLLNWMQWGWKIRFGAGVTKGKGSIARVAEPFALPDFVLACAVPLFKRFR